MNGGYNQLSKGINVTRVKEQRSFHIARTQQVSSQMKETTSMEKMEKRGLPKCQRLIKQRNKQTESKAKQNKTLFPTKENRKKSKASAPSSVTLYARKQ